MGALDLMTRSHVPDATRSVAGVPAQNLLPILGSVPSATGLSVNQSSAMGVSTVFACASARSKDFARCVPRLMKAGSSRSETPVTDHPVAKLLAAPNRLQTWHEFAVQMQTAFLLRGNGYAVILRDAKGDPVELIPQNPDAVLILEAVDGQIFYQVNRVGLFQLSALRALPMAVPAEDVFHIKSSTFNILLGLSTIGLARDAIGVAMGLEQQSARFMANGARPSGVLTSPKKLTQDTANRLRDQWASFRSGIQNTGTTAVLEEGITWNQMQLTSVDLEFMAQRQFSIQEIARYFGVPLYKVGGELPRGIKVDQLDQSYVNSTIMPDLDMWEQKFNQVFDLGAENLTVDFDERKLLRAEEATRVNNQRLKIMSGISTQNECRRENGDPPMPGADVLLTPVNLAAVGSDMSGQAPDGAGRPAEGTLPDPGAANQSKASRLTVRAADGKKTLYVHRPLLNAADIIAWAEAQGFSSTLKGADMHATVAYSREAVDWKAVAPDENPVVIDPDDDPQSRQVVALGDKGAVVMKFASSALAARWQAFRDAGASWDFPEYQPHVTITYDGAPADLSAVEPYGGVLEFGPEVFAELDEDWADKIVEDDTEAKAGAITIRTYALGREATTAALGAQVTEA